MPFNTATEHSPSDLRRYSPCRWFDSPRFRLLGRLRSICFNSALAARRLSSPDRGALSKDEFTPLLSILLTLPGQSLPFLFLSPPRLGQVPALSAYVKLRFGLPLETLECFLGSTFVPILIPRSPRSSNSFSILSNRQLQKVTLTPWRGILTSGSTRRTLSARTGILHLSVMSALVNLVLDS